MCLTLSPTHLLSSAIAAPTSVVNCTEQRRIADGIASASSPVSGRLPETPDSKRPQFFVRRKFAGINMSIDFPPLCEAHHVSTSEWLGPPVASSSHICCSPELIKLT
jgi:hypothetical protein